MATPITDDSGRSPETLDVNPADAATPHRDSFWSFEAALFLLVLALVVFARWRLLSLPLERDEGEYAYGAQILDGAGLLYRDLHSMKWPWIYTAYSSIMKLFGETRSGIHTGLLWWNLVSAVGVYLVARQQLEKRFAAFAAAAFLVLTVLPATQGLIANAEHFAMIWGIFGWWLLSFSLPQRNWPVVLLAGLVMGFGPTMKQHAIFFVAMGGLLALASPWPTSLREFVKNVLAAAVYSIGVFLVWGLMFYSIWRQGIWDEFYLWTMVYPKDYTSQMPLEWGIVSFQFHFFPILKVIWPLCLIAVYGMISVLRTRKGSPSSTPAAMSSLLPSQEQPASLLPSREKLAVRPDEGASVASAPTVDRQPLHPAPHPHGEKESSRNPVAGLYPFGLLLAGMAATVPGYYFRTHYFLFVMPGLALFAAYGLRAIEQSRDEKSQTRGLWLASIAAVLTLGIPLGLDGPLLFWKTPDQVSRAMYDFNPFVESPRVSEYLKAHMDPEDEMVIFGSEPQICFEAQRKLASGYVYMYPMMEIHSLAKTMQAQMIEEVTAARPKYAVLVAIGASWTGREKSEPMLVNWMNQYLREEYYPVAVIRPIDEDETDYLFAGEGETIDLRQFHFKEESMRIVIFKRKKA